MRNIVRQTVVLGRAAILAIATLVSSSSFAQLNAKYLSRYTELDGLPGVRVSNMVADLQCYIWIGTVNKLARFDGCEFKRYYSDPNDSNSMQGLLVWSMFHAHKEQIWICSSPEYFNFYIPVTRFKLNRPNFFEPPFGELSAEVLISVQDNGSVTLKYGGLENVTPENFALEHSMSLTLQLQRETGEPVMRAGLVVDWNDHSYYCSGSVPQGSKVRFSLPPDFDVIEKTIKGCEDLKRTEMPDADALLLFNCGGRLLSLGPLISEEIEGIRSVWNVPMAGMFSNAELARATNGNLEMHAFTACTVALKEK